MNCASDASISAHTLEQLSIFIHTSTSSCLVPVPLLPPPMRASACVCVHYSEKQSSLALKCALTRNTQIATKLKSQHTRKFVREYTQTGGGKWLLSTHEKVTTVPCDGGCALRLMRLHFCAVSSFSGARVSKRRRTKQKVSNYTGVDGGAVAVAAENYSLLSYIDCGSIPFVYEAQDMFLVIKAASKVQ